MNEKVKVIGIVFGHGANTQFVLSDGSVLDVIFATETHNHPCAIITDERRQRNDLFNPRKTEDRQ